MKERSEQDHQRNDAALAKRKRIAMGVGRVVMLLVGSFWLLLFVAAVRTGYPSRIGIAVGALFAGPMAVSPILGWAGKKRLEGILLGVPSGIIVLVVLAVVTPSLWPEGKGTWRPYRFDDELAAMEGGRGVPEAENAARRYDAAFAEVDVNDQPDYLLSGVSLRDELGKRPWEGDDYPQASEWLDSHAEIIDRLLAIGGMEKCRWPVQADTYDEYTVPYKGLHYSVRLLIAAGNRDLGEDRVSSALTKYFCVLRVADHLRQQPSTLNSFISFRVERDALQMIRHALAQSSLSDEDIAQIAHHLSMTAELWPQEWTGLLEYEKLRYMNLLGRLYEINDSGEIRFATDPVISPGDEQGQKDEERTDKIPRLYWLMSMPRDPHAVRGIADRYFAKLDPIANSEHLPQTDRKEQTAFAPPSDFIKMVCNFYRWWAETAFFDEEECIQYRQVHAECIVRRRGTWLVLGLRRYRDVHGAWPQTLDDVSNYVPPEAFADPVAGDAFVYARDGDSFRLYSKGPNREDEGGRCYYVRALDKVEDDIPLWPPPPPPEPPDEESIKKELEDIYGSGYHLYFGPGADGPNKSADRSGMKAPARKQE